MYYDEKTMCDNDTMGKTMKQHIKILGAVLLLLINIIALTGCTDNQNNANNDNTEQSSSGLISAMDAFAKVQSDMLEWDSNYQIARIHHFGTSEYAETGKEDSWEFYVEGANAQKSTDFTYTVGSGVTKSTDSSYGTGRNTCSPEDIKVDSTTACATALNKVTSDLFPEFEGGCKAELKVDSEGNPYWQVTADNRHKDGHFYLIKTSYNGYVEIDAKTGEIITFSD
jgi:hypothetical protein